MGIIDRYLLRQFIQTFLICYLSLTGLYVVFDAFTNLEAFLECADRAGGLARLMGRYYIFRAIFFFDRMAGILTLVSAMFTVTWIRRHNELTALMAAGISRVRVVLPVICASMLIALFAAANRELVIPNFREELARTPNDLLGDVSRNMDLCFDNVTDIAIDGRGTCANRRRVTEPKFVLPDTLDDYGRQLTAEEAFYRPTEAGRPGGYLLKGVKKPEDLHLRPSLKLDGKPVIITPHDASDWLRKDECFVASDVSFEQLTGGNTWRLHASTAQLISGLRNPSLNFGADVRVAIHSRILQPFADITLLFLGLPLVLTRENRNVFIAIGLCVLVVSVFVSVALAFQYLGASGIWTPSWAAWAPLIIFVPLAVGMAESMWE